MGCLNEKLPIDMKMMKKVILQEIDDIIDHELYYVNDIEKVKKERLKNNIIKELKNKFNSDHFIYRIIHEDHCNFKHERGKNDGKFCCKRITINGNKKKYICRVHNKDHVPKKKIKLLDDKSFENSKNNKILEKSKNIINKNNSILLRTDISKNLNKNYHEKIKNIKKIKNPLKCRNPKTYINNFNINDFKRVINYYNYNYLEPIICKHDRCSSNECQFKHKNNILLSDFIPKDILSY